MIEYIYIVKCPDREDEMFNFFTDARMQCDLLMSKKPSITQVEVERNDFGECTDSHDLGTVWSWEEAMKDTEGGYTDAEPTKSVFTKDDLKLMADGQDPEFDNLDNSVDCEEPETSEVSPIERKPIPEGMTINQLKEAMEENEDTVECAGCEELFPKEDCFHKDGIGWLCGDCEDRIVRCTWCEDLYDKGECRYEVDLGWLCDRCEAAIKSRGETLTFREGSYWDFLDEDFEDTRTLADLVKDSISHLTNDLGKDPWAEDFADDVITDLENNYGIYVPEDMDKYNSWCSEVACEVSRQVNNPSLSESQVQPESLKEAAISSDTVDLEYDELTITVCGNQRDVDDWDEAEHTDSYTYTVDRDEIKVLIWEKFLTEEDVAKVPGGFDALEDDTAWEEFIEENFDKLFDKYHDQILDHYREDAEEEFSENFTFADYDEYWRDFWNDPDADYHNRFDD